MSAHQISRSYTLRVPVPSGVFPGPPDKKNAPGQKKRKRDKISKHAGDKKNTNGTKKTWVQKCGVEGGGAKPRKGGSPKGGAPQGGAPKGGGGPKFRAFFFPSPTPIFILFFSLWGSSRGILVVFEAPGRSNVRVWSSLVVVWKPPAACRPPGFHRTT